MLVCLFQLKLLYTEKGTHMVPSVTVKRLDYFLMRRVRLGAEDFSGAGSAGFTASTGGVGAATGSGAVGAAGAGASTAFGVGAVPLIRSPNLDIFNS